jgi:hypothetical protein
MVIDSKKTMVPVDAPSKSITYLSLQSVFSHGNLTIVAGHVTFHYALPVGLSGT